MKKFLLLLIAVMSVTIYSCTKENLSESHSVKATSIQAKKDTVPPAATFRVLRDTVPPAIKPGK